MEVGEKKFNRQKKNIAYNSNVSLKKKKKKCDR